MVQQDVLSGRAFHGTARETEHPLRSFLNVVAPEAPDSSMNWPSLS
jgi:hypothetical protein